MKPIPTTYRGIEFRSRLEAEWARNLTALGIRWEYEVEGYVLADGTRYLPDFWLPDITTWLEVKGPDVPGLDKTTKFAVEAAHASGCTMQDCGCDVWDPRQAVVVGRPSGKFCGPLGSEHVVLARCRKCDGTFFVDTTRSYRCRKCGAHDGDHHLERWDDPAEVPWIRLPKWDVQAAAEQAIRRLSAAPKCPRCARVPDRCDKCIDGWVLCPWQEYSVAGLDGLECGCGCHSREVLAHLAGTCEESCWVCYPHGDD